MDFSKLTDDQLLQLIQEALAEAVSRGVTVATRVKDAYVDAQEAAQIKAEAFRKAAELAEERERSRLKEQARREALAAVAAQEQKDEIDKTKALWEKKKAIAIALEEWGLREDWQINIWSRGADRRVYVDGGGDHSWAWKICFYVSGNSYHPPGAIDVEGKKLLDKDNPLLKGEEKWEEFKSFLAAVAQKWQSLKVSRSDVQNYDGIANSKHLALYRQALTRTAEAPR